VAAAQEVEPRYALRAICLLAVLVLSKALSLVLAHGAVSWSLWTPIAYFWQDILLALCFLAVDATIRRSAVGWGLYAAIAIYAAINVPIAVVLSTPLTWTMIRATGSALADSIAYYVTPKNALGFGLPLLSAVALPLWLRNRRIAVSRAALVAAIAIVVLGFLTASRVDTRGMHRNAIGALVSTSVSRLPPKSSTISSDDWRLSPFEATTGENLSRYRGIASGRNVVIVILESVAARYLGVYGAARDPTPTLSRLAGEAIVFERAYAVYPESVKGLFSTLCAQYTAFDTSPELYAAVPCTSLADRLRAAGYHTALFHSGRFDYLGMKAIIDNRGFLLLEDAGAIGGNIQSSFGVDEEATVRRMLAWIDARNRAAPFFITYLPIAGHHPYVATRRGPFDGNTDFVRYLNALHEGDEALGELFEGFRARGLDRKTMFVIVGDHGEAFGQHPGNFAHTLFIYEENVRVPYMIVAPGVITDRVRVRRLASVVDTSPTVLDLLGLPVSPKMQGASLLDPASRMALFYTDYSLGWLGLADGCWKYLFEMDGARSSLFEVCADPDETRNRSEEFPERVTAYRDRVRSWAAAQKAMVDAASAR
jgi:glucan phosphoethanolaminetransferase (alkaline phosphatase superfamily)